MTSQTAQHLDSLAWLETAPKLSNLYINRYLAFASFTVLVYDHALTFDQEYHLIWKAKFSWASLLFLWNRYLAPLGVFLNAFTQAGFPGISYHFCEVFIRVQRWWIVSLITSCYVLLSLRVYALLQQSRLRPRVMFIISVVPPVVVVICTTLTTIHTSDSADDNIFYLPAFESCFRMPLSYDWVPMLVPLLVDILLFGITLYHAMQYRRFGVRLPLMSVIWRDGLIWFIVMFVVFGISTIIYARYTQDLIIPDALVCCAVQTGVSRLIFNLRAAYDSPVPGSLPSSATNGMTFAPPANVSEHSDEESASWESNTFASHHLTSEIPTETNGSSNQRPQSQQIQSLQAENIIPANACPSVESTPTTPKLNGSTTGLNTPNSSTPPITASRILAATSV